MNYSDKYKVRAPEETIKIIEDFFTEQGLKIIQLKNFHSTADTYSCQYGLFLNNRKILITNGKGMTETFSKASGLAELYERYCKAIQSRMGNPFLPKRNDLLSMTQEQLLDDPYVKEYMTLLYPDLINIPSDYLYGQKYYSLKNNDVKIKNYSLLSGFLGTNGHAAGNTIEEALVQGCSEIFERICIQKFYTQPQERYYYVDKTTLNPILQQRLANIEEYGFDVEIFDLSYNFNLPVCLILQQHKTNGSIFINFGAFPIFDIAVERCITELYQGITTLLDVPVPMVKIVDKHNMNVACLNQQMTAKAGLIYLQPNLFLNYKKVNSYNKDIFLNDANISNLNLLQHLMKLTDMNFYFTDLSLSDRIKAVHITTDPPMLNNYLQREHERLYHMSYEDRIINQFLTIQSYKIVDLLKNYNIQTAKQEINNTILFFANNNLDIISYIEGNDYFKNYIMTLCHPIRLYKYDNYKEHFNDFKNFFYVLMEQNGEVNFTFDGEYKKKYIYYLLQQKNDNLLDKIYLETIQEIYNSQDYKDFCELFKNKKRELN